MRGPIRGQFTGHVITSDQSEAKLREKRGDRDGGTGGRLKGSNHKEQEQRRFVGTPWTLAVSSSTQNTHSCLFQIFDTKWQNVPEGLPPPAEQRRMFREKIYSAKKYTRLSAKKYTLNTINLILIYCFDLNDLQRIQRI